MFKTHVLELLALFLGLRLYVVETLDELVELLLDEGLLLELELLLLLELELEDLLDSLDAGALDSDSLEAGIEVLSIGLLGCLLS